MKKFFKKIAKLLWSSIITRLAIQAKRVAMHSQYTIFISGLTNVPSVLLGVMHIQTPDSAGLRFYRCDGDDS